MNIRRMISGAVAVAALAVGGIVTKGLWPASKADAACCYFAAQEKDINQPGQKAFITWDPAQKIASWTVQPKFEGNAVDFGMVIPSPGQPKLDEMPRDFFKDLAIYTILMPLPQVMPDQLMHRRINLRARGGGGVPSDAPGKMQDEKDHGVKVLEAGVVGSLDYKVITAEKASGLFDWLKENNYVYSGDEGTLKFYIDKKWFFTVMKIDPKQMKKATDGSYVGEVTPTRFTFSSDACVYPLRITSLSVKTATDALFYVQSPEQMDLPGDLSWMHSYRVMWLTYMLGCSANESQQKELNERNNWVANKKSKDPKFDTTKLEWGMKLGTSEMGVLEDPLANYSQMGNTLPPGSATISLEQYLKDLWTAWEKAETKELDESEAKELLRRFETTYASDKGMIVKVEKPNPAMRQSTYMWYAKREAPAEDVKGLARLKGHLQGGQWLTKFRKILRKDEMTDDLLLSPVPAGQEQEYSRIMPTSPP